MQGFLLGTGASFELGLPLVYAFMLHVESDPARALEEAASALRPQDRMIIATYCHGEKLSPELVANRDQCRQTPSNGSRGGP